MERSMRIIDYSKLIEGKQFTGKCKKVPFRGNEETLELAYKMLYWSPNVITNLNRTQNANAFYSVEPDLEYEIPVEQKEEVYYSIKLGYICRECPAKILYYIDNVYRLYKSFNLVVKVLPKSMLSELFKEGYIEEGYSLKDIINTIWSSKWRVNTDDVQLLGKDTAHKCTWYPVSSEKLYSPNSNNCWDIYIESTDMIAIVPEKLKQILTCNTDTIENLTVSNNSIMLLDIPIKTLGGYIGATNSTYDLSSLV